MGCVSGVCGGLKCMGTGCSVCVRWGLSRAFGHVHVGLCKHGSGMSREVLKCL